MPNSVWAKWTLLGAWTLTMVGLALGGCRDRPAQRPPIAEAPEAATPLILGLIPEHNVFEQRRQYRPLCDYLSAQLHVDVRLKTLPSYGMILDEFRRGETNAAFFGSFSYVVAHAQVGAQILARPEYLEGGANYRAYIFTRRDRGITSPDQLRGKRYAFVHPLTTAGYLFERSYLGLRSPEALEDYFEDFFFAGSHDASALAVYEGRADGGGGKDRVFKRLARQNPLFADRMVVLAESPPVPSNGLAVSAAWSGDRRKRLQELLLGLHQDPRAAAALKELGIRRFVLTRDEDYAPVVEMAQSVGIDLKTYRGTLP